MKKFIASLASFAVLFLVAFGLASVAGACWSFLYQAEMPQKPQK